MAELARVPKELRLHETSIDAMNDFRDGFIREAAAADGWMAVIWTIKDGRLQIAQRTTCKFPHGDFPVAELQLREMNTADERSAQPKRPAPLPPATLPPMGPSSDPVKVFGEENVPGPSGVVDANNDDDDFAEGMPWAD